MEMALAARAQQQAANSARQAALQQSAQAQQRALQALTAGTGLAGQLSQEQTALELDKARAKDLINKFNTLSEQQRQQRNIGAQNVAAMENLRGREAVQRQNVEQANIQEQQNKALIQQRYENELARARAARGLAGEQARQQVEAGRVQAQQAAAPWQAATQAISTFGSMYGREDDE